ncbi:complex I subunit 4 family protein [Paludisphaera rhizosphaerae]|uniref:complex I subunit 4 family protein n=1 Tax=Paludisphaera rhizosphaerae TaxID=2711216 RepID=UPI0013ECAA21|nr:NADH-quinone oxidoreductase subunit M [Paludisphaera rhizosphaerae]
MAILLAVTVFLPLLGALALVLTPGLDQGAARKIALGFTVATFAACLALLAGFESSVTTPQFAAGPDAGPYGWSWIGRPDVRFALGLDGISIWLFVLTGLLMITGVFASWESIKDRSPLYYAFLLSLETGLLGLFASLDVVLFYIFFEFTLIPLFFIIGLWGGPDRHRASVYFFLYTLAGSLLTLLGVIALVVVHMQYTPEHRLTFSIPELTQGLAALQWDEWYKTDSWASPQVAIFLLLLAGFAIKVPLFPFHTWLPLAHVEAPTAGSIVLAGVLLKVGSYGLLRFNMAMTPLGAQALFPLLATLCVAGIIYGALAALAQSDMKRLVAYSSVSHMGFIVLGMLAMNDTGLNGSVIQMVNHGLTTGALFACVGILYDRYHTREMGQLGGMWEKFPLLAFFFIFSSMGAAALPGLNGFVGEFPILSGMFAVSWKTAALATTGMVLGAFYLLLMIRRVIFGPLVEPGGHDDHGHGHAEVPPIAWYEIAGLAPLMALILYIGLFPEPFFSRIRPAVEVVDRIGRSEALTAAKVAAAPPVATRGEAVSMTASEAR